MENDQIINIYIEKIFEDLNNVNKEKLILRANAEVATKEIEQAKAIIAELENSVNEGKSRISSLESELESLNRNNEGLRNKLSSSERYIQDRQNISPEEKTELLTQISNLNEKIRLLTNSNSFLIKSVKEKEAKIVELSTKKPKKKAIKEAPALNA
jgi:chromosome segregation ATPase